MYSQTFYEETIQASQKVMFSWGFFSNLKWNALTVITEIDVFPQSMSSLSIFF
jgi:hypothetical protein